MSPAPVSQTAGRLAQIIPIGLVGIVLLMVAPLAPILLDGLLAISIALSLALLLVSLHLERPLDLSSFPTILLFVTLLRLALNVASTRLILSEGAQGPSAAGGIIRAFGEFVVGGNYVVGAAIFLLLVIINFVVITKGSGRVAEVSARFTLDALPGKQMSIDADLGAGLITQEQARERRSTVERESDFFGSMDGASKFVRGDAIAGLLMTAINIIVGFVVGTLQQGLSAAEAANTYTVLTVGDGLASQIPSLLVSTAAGVVVTRAAGGEALGATLVRQIANHRASLYGTAGLMAAIGLVPGMPLIPFMGLAGLLTLGARALAPEAGLPVLPKAKAETGDKPATEQEHIESLLKVELLEFEVGFDLVHLVDSQRGGELVERIAAIRRNLASEFGIVIPLIQIRDNLRLPAHTYRLMLSGTEVGRGALRVRKWLAMDPSGSLPKLAGEQVKEPAFGLPAIWVGESDRAKAEQLGYTLVDAPTVAATHLTELLRNLAPDLLGRQEAQDLIDLLAQQQPRLVDEVIPNLLPVGEVVKVMRNLLREGISIRDLRSVFEAIADHAREIKDTAVLTEFVRQRLARQISARFLDDNNTLSALTLDAGAEQALRAPSSDVAAAQKLLSSLDRSAHLFGGLATPPVLLCAADVRRPAADFLGQRIPGLAVLSYAELDRSVNVRNLGVVG